MNLTGVTLEKYGETYNLDLEFSAYRTGNLAVVSWCEGEPYDTLTVNVPDIPEGCLAVSDMEPEYVIILHDAGIISSTSPVGQVGSGFIMISFYQMSDDAIHESNDYLSGIHQRNVVKWPLPYLLP